MIDEFDAIMKRILKTDNDWVQDFAALVPLGAFVLEHLDELRMAIATLDTPAETDEANE